MTATARVAGDRQCAVLRSSVDMVDQFLDAVCVKPGLDHRAGSSEEAGALLLAHPGLTEASIAAAAAAGDFVRLEAQLRREPELATSRGGVRGWSPLLYLCYSHLLSDDRQRLDAYGDCARLLLDRGADANDFWTSPDGERESALYGAAGLANAPEVTQALLDAGAAVTNPPDNEVLYHTAEHLDPACLRLILAAKPDFESVCYGMCHNMDRENPECLRLFVEAGADVNWRIDRGVFTGYRPLHFAIYRRRSNEVLGILLDAGADPNALADNRLSPVDLALRLGLSATAERLIARGGRSSGDMHARLLAAIALGQEDAVHRLVQDGAQLRPDDHHLLVDLADAGNAHAVRLLLDLGVPVDTRRASYGGWDGTALHHAAWAGHAEVVRLLLERGADPRARHAFNGDALSAAEHGAIHAHHGRGNGAAEVIRRHLAGSS